MLIASSVNPWSSSVLSRTKWREGTLPKRNIPSEQSRRRDEPDRNRYRQIEDGTLDSEHLTGVVGGLRVEGGAFDEGDYPLNAIRVKHTTEIVQRQTRI